jgi:hypothetical protein
VQYLIVENTINLVLNVTSTATPGSRSVDVSSNGASGQGFLPGSGVSSRSNAKSIAVNGVGSCVYSIPIDGDKFSIGSDYLTAAIPLQVTTSDPGCLGTVQWSVTFSYYPSRGFPTSNSSTLSICGKVNEAATVSTPPGVGGRGSVIATIIVNGKPVGNVPATIYVDGIQLPEYAAQELLTTLYTQQGGTTRTLMAAVAQQESQLQQFNWTGRWAYSPLWGRDGYWPTESYDIKNGNGSHIGLMQMPTNMVDAYNWSQNASDGVNFFYQQKLNGKAKAYEAALHQQCPSLPAFTAGDTEMDALAFYGPGASNTLGAYWAAGPNCSEWIVNPMNKKATDYAATVHAIAAGMVE